MTEPVQNKTTEEETTETDLPEDYQLWDFIARLLVGSHGYNIPDVLGDIKMSLDGIKESIDINSKCQLKLAQSIAEKNVEP